MARVPTVVDLDGRALSLVGDVVLSVYGTKNTMRHNLWLWGHLERAIAAERSIVVVSVVLPGTPPADTEVRDNSVQMIAKHSAGLRRVLTVVEGDALWRNVVGSVARASSVRSGSNAISQVVDSVDVASDLVQQVATPRTPPRSELLTVLQSVRARVAGL